MRSYDPFEQVGGNPFEALFGTAGSQLNRTFEKQRQGPELAPGERIVTNQVRDEMLIRRAGNICLDARERGWKVQRLTNDGAFGPVVEFVFVKGVHIVRGYRHRDRRQALINAAEELAKIL